MGENAAEDFPIVCETCLGDNPFIRMTKENWGKACKICDRPFTVFRWRPGARARFKKTEICQTCAKMKNVCQTCILDLIHGLPVEVRDSVLDDSAKMVVAKSTTNRDFAFEQYEKQIVEGGADRNSPYGKIVTNRTLEKYSRPGPYYKRNLPHICSFWVKGDCARGEECPYRHEKPITGELANQNIKDRFYGINDPVARKMMRENKELQEANEGRKHGPSSKPADKSISTLFVGGIDERFTEDELREKFAIYGVISSISLVPLKGCAFVTYSNRIDAEQAVEALHDSIVLHRVRLRVDWGKGKSQNKVTKRFPLPPGMNRAKAPAGNFQTQQQFPGQNVPFIAPPAFVPPPPGMSSAMYPSMNPHSHTAKLSEKAPSERA